MRAIITSVPGHRRQRRQGNGERRRRRLLTSILVSVAGLTFWCSQAAAQPPHVFSSSFGEAGAGAGQLTGPRGIAVNESTGRVYVADRGNNRVDVFDAGGKFLEAWGWGVTNGAKEFQICTSSCQAGLAGAGKGQLKLPEAIAIDNSASASDPSAGDVYVSSNPEGLIPTVKKYTATGEPLNKLPAKEEGKVDGLAVDVTGNVWLYRAVEESGEIEGFSNKPANKSLEVTFPSEATCAEPGLAVDAHATAFYVNHQREKEEACPASLGEAPINTAKLNEFGEVQYKAADAENTSGVAVDLATGELFLDNISTIAAFGPSGEFLERFGAGHLTAGGDLAVNSKTRTVYVVEPTANKVLIFTQPPAAPVVESVSSRNLTTTSAELSAQVDPSGADTHYYFQYGTVECKTSPSSCTNVPAPPGNDLGSSFLPQTASVEVTGLSPSTIYYYRVIAENSLGSAEGSGTFTTLPTTEGVLADNRAWELVSPAEKFGVNIEPIGAVGAPQGGPIEASESGGSITYVANGPLGPEPQGNRSPEAAQILSARSSGGWATQDIVTPHAKGEGIGSGEPAEYQAFSNDLAAALVQPFGLKGITQLQEPPLVPGVTSEQRGIYRRSNSSCPSSCYQPLVTAANNTGNPNFGGELEFLGSSADANHAVFASPISLLAGTPEGERNLYEWNAGEPGQLKPVNVRPDGKLQAGGSELGTEANAARSARNAVSSDGSRVIWSSTENNRLYMRDTVAGETIQLNKVEEGSGLPEPGEEEPELDQVRFQTASADGSKVFFTDTARLTLSSHLSPTEGESPSDLYECEIVKVAGELTCNLTNVTEDRNAGEVAAVQGVVPGSSDDGSYVYFVANGALAAGAKPGDCSGAEGHCNLYVRGPDPKNPGQFATTLIARLSGEDGPTWLAGGQAEPNLPRLTSRVSPNGRYFAFMSNSSLTGYNNVDANPAAKGARDEEVFLYDATTNRLACASCNPSGAQPKGVFDTVHAGEGSGLIIDREETWRGRWIAANLPGWTALNLHQAHYQSRYLSDEGRLFFNSADPITSPPSGAVATREEVVEGTPTQVGVANVYQYEPSGMGTCKGGSACVSLISSGTSAHESSFMDASTSGNDAFFITSTPLVAAEHELNFSLYDARVCTKDSPCLSFEEVNPRPCESSETCRPGPATQPGFPTPGTGASFPPEGVSKQAVLPDKNKVKPKALTRAQKLALALKSCRKKYKGKHSKKRASCERRARKAFAPPKHSKAKKK